MAGTLFFREYPGQNLCWFFNDRKDYDDILAKYGTYPGINEEEEFSLMFVLQNVEIVEDFKISFSILDIAENGDTQTSIIYYQADLNRGRNKTLNF